MNIINTVDANPRYVTKPGPFLSKPRIGHNLNLNYGSNGTSLKIWIKMFSFKSILKVIKCTSDATINQFC